MHLLYSMEFSNVDGVSCESRIDRSYLLRHAIVSIFGRCPVVNLFEDKISFFNRQSFGIALEFPQKDQMSRMLLSRPLQLPKC